MKDFFEQFEKNKNTSKRQLQLWKSTVNKIEKNYGSISNWENSIDVKYKFFEDNYLLNITSMEPYDSFIKVLSNENEFIFEKSITGIKLKNQEKKIKFFNLESRKKIIDELKK